MSILGIDHGAMSGWGLIEDGKAKAYGWFAVTKGSTGQKLCDFRENIAAIINLYKPKTIVLERPNHRRNARTSILLDGYYTMILSMAYRYGIKGENIIEAYPSSVKKAITGRGNAEKHEVAEAVAKMVGLDLEQIVCKEFYMINTKHGKKGEVRKVHYDKSDALALALYGQQMRRQQ